MSNTRIENATITEDTAIGLLRMFRRYNLCDDRRGYDAEDLMQAYPELPLREAKKLQRILAIYP